MKIQLPQKWAQPPIFGPGLLWPNDQGATWYEGRSRPRRHCVRWGPTYPKRGTAPVQFSAHFRCGQTAGCIKMPLGTDVGLSPGDSVLDGNPCPLPIKGVEPPPEFSAQSYCGQTAGCIEMPLGMEVVLRPGDFGLDGDPPTPPPKMEAEAGGRAPPIFGPWLLWPSG